MAATGGLARGGRQGRAGATRGLLAGSARGGDAATVSAKVEVLVVDFVG